jgi:hypothetical protein
LHPHRRAILLRYRAKVLLQRGKLHAQLFTYALSGLARALCRLQLRPKGAHEHQRLAFPRTRSSGL